MDMNDNSAQRNSPPTASQDSLNTPPDCFEPLGGTACSASSCVEMTLDEKKALWTKLTLELGSKENRSRCKDITKLAYDFKWLLWDDYTPKEIKSLSAFGEF